jgi:hypothetical protein
VGAEGAGRCVVKAMAEASAETSWRRTRVRRYEDDNKRVYKTVPFTVPESWRRDVNYSVRSKDGRVNFDALPADKFGSYLGIIVSLAPICVLAIPSDPPSSC